MRGGGGKKRMHAVKLHAHKKDARPACTHMHPQDADNAGDNKEKKEKDKEQFQATGTKSNKLMYRKPFRGNGLQHTRLLHER